MGRAKEILIKPINSKVANDFVKKHHYSGKIVQNSVLHFGAFLDNRLHGVLDKRKMLGLVKGTLWNEFLELNRMAFDEYLPKFSESRCIAISLKMIKKQYPHIKWIISFADGTQCGDGTIYRASGFVLTAIKKNNQIIECEGRIMHKHTLNEVPFKGIGGEKTYEASRLLQLTNGSYSTKKFFEALNKEYKQLDGFQLRYIYFLLPKEKENLTVPILPFSKIDEMGAGMYKGKKRKLCDNSVKEHVSNSIEKEAV